MSWRRSQDTSLHEVIQGACDDILRFLDDVLATSNSSGDQNVHGDLIALADIREVPLNNIQECMSN